MLSEVKRIRILLRKTTFGGSTFLLFSVEASHKPGQKAESLSFLHIRQCGRDVSTTYANPIGRRNRSTRWISQPNPQHDKYRWLFVGKTIPNP